MFGHSYIMSDAIAPFNRNVVRAHRDRAAGTIENYDFLYRETAERLCDRLSDITRVFPTALDLGCHGGEIGQCVNGRGGIQRLYQCDLSAGMAARAAGANPRSAPFTRQADEEALPFGSESLDLVLSNLSLHWANDLPGAFIQIRQALRPEGLFLATMLGGETLKEIRQAMAEAEIAEEKSVSPRVSPFADVRDAGGLLQRTGFQLPVVDSETMTVSYPDPFKLMKDLRGMGETNAVNDRRPGFTRRRTMMRMAERYVALFGDSNGRVPATFQVLTLPAWAPGAGQPNLPGIRPKKS